MTLTLLAALALAADKPACEAACAHMTVVSNAEMDREKSLSDEVKKKVRADSAVKEPERMKKCVAGCEQGKFEPACVLAATETMGARGYARCLSASKAAKGSPNPGVPEAQARKLVDALSAVKAESRLALLGAGLAEVSPAPYGADLTQAFEALGQQLDRSRRTQVVFQSLLQPLAQLGCAQEVKAAIALKPALQGPELVKTCAPDRALIAPSRAEKSSFELAALALVMEGRAREGGFEKSPLHVRAIELLLKP